MVVKYSIFYLVVFTLFVISPLSAATPKLTIACASNFVATLNKVIVRYKQDHDVNFVVIQGSSAKLSSQLIHGLPADIFLSADKKHAQYLIEKQRADDLFLYAIGEIVFLIKTSTMATSASEILIKSKPFRLSLANPVLSPYGAHSKMILQHLGVWEKFASDIIYGDNIGLAFNYILTGNAPAGLVARSQVKQYEEIHNKRIVPLQFFRFKDSASEISQYGVLLKSSQALSKAQDFVTFLIQSKEAQQILHNMGYKTITI